MHILLVEDDRSFARVTVMLLTKAGFRVESTDLGEDAVFMAKDVEYDLIVLDLGLPDISGHNVLQMLRIARVNTPVLILSGLGDERNKLRGFEGGADDFLVKPFSSEELVARCHAIVRRSRGHASSILEAGPLEMDLDAQEVRVLGQLTHLTGKEFEMLKLLMLRKNATLTKDAFLNAIYGGMDEPDTKIIDVYICKIRKKLRDASGGHNFIQTVWGRGYALKELSMNQLDEIRIASTR